MRSGLLFAGLAGLALAFPTPGAALPEARPAAPVPAPAPFILDPGHGGQDWGAVVGKKREKDIALAIARKIKERLETLTGVPVRLTRDSDDFVPLDERVDESLSWEGTAFISLHLNQVRSKKRQGMTVYAFGRGGRGGWRLKHHTVPPLPAPSKEEAQASRKLADTIVRSLRAQGYRAEPPARAGFYVLKNPSIPSVLIELGYLSNPTEAARLNDPAYQDKLAQAIAVSLQAYLATARGPVSAATGGR